MIRPPAVLARSRRAGCWRTCVTDSATSVLPAASVGSATSINFDGGKGRRVVVDGPEDWSHATHFAAGLFQFSLGACALHSRQLISNKTLFIHIKTHSNLMFILKSNIIDNLNTIRIIIYSFIINQPLALTQDAEQAKDSNFTLSRVPFFPRVEW